MLDDLVVIRLNRFAKHIRSLVLCCIPKSFWCMFFLLWSNESKLELKIWTLRNRENTYVKIGNTTYALAIFLYQKLLGPLYLRQFKYIFFTKIFSYQKVVPTVLGFFNKDSISQKDADRYCVLNAQNYLHWGLQDKRVVGMFPFYWPATQATWWDLSQPKL